MTSSAVADAETTRLVCSVLGALVGYVAGGVLGRAIVRQVDTASAHLERVPAAQLIAATLGASVGALAGVALLLPVVLLPLQRYTVPVTVLVIIALGLRRWPSRRVPRRGPRPVRRDAGPARGARRRRAAVGVKLVDTSALVDGRLVEVARAGFLEGLLVIPTFVLHEVQALADSSDEAVRRRRPPRPRPASGCCRTRPSSAVEITEDDDPSVRRGRRQAGRAGQGPPCPAAHRGRRAGVGRRDRRCARAEPPRPRRGGAAAGPARRAAHGPAAACRPGSRPGGRPTSTTARWSSSTARPTRLGADLEVTITSIVSGRRGRMLFASLGDVAPPG